MRTILIALLMAHATQVQGHHGLANRNLENGYSNYQEYCASCHGVNLEGQANWRSRNEDGTLPAPPHDETGHTWHHETEMLFEYTKLVGQVTLEAVVVKNFTSGMPAFGGILLTNKFGKSCDIFDQLGLNISKIRMLRDIPHPN